jgi:prepilin-type N-terminal cleavage/methylation domain-containing protein
MFKPIDTIRNPKGFTIVEMVVAMSISLIGVAGGYALLANVQGTMAGNSAVTQAQQEARLVVERVTRELQESSRDWVWPSPMPEGGSDYIVFITPRNENRVFVVNDDGSPQWQRAILYRLDSDSMLRRYQLYMSGTVEPNERYQSEVVSKNVEELLFNRLNNDMITISIRTFSDQGGKVGHVAKSRADLYTMVKLRN